MGVESALAASEMGWVMSAVLSFTVDGKPQGKQRARRGKGGRWYTQAATVVYENTVSAEALAAMTVSGIVRRYRRYSGPVNLTVACYFPDARRRDADNVLKSVMDGMNGIAYRDDSQVTKATVTKAIDREHPRTEIEVTYEAH